MSRRTSWALVVASGLLIGLPASAPAAKRTVFMGVPPANQKAFEKIASDVNAFFPSNLRIRVGDTAAFTPAGFHTVDMPATGTAGIPLIVPTGKKAAGVTDAANAPFWFNGLDQVGLNPLLTKSGFGKSFVAGTKRVQSGLPLANRPKPMNVRFPKAGLFKYFCDVHPGMRGTVRVVGRSKATPSAAAVARSVSRQAAAALSIAKGLPAATKPPANTISAGAEGSNGVVRLAFLPNKLTVPVGTDVTFAMPAKSSEVHTATAGPGNPMTEPRSYLGMIAASFQGAAFDPRATYPSEPPPAVGALSPALHGNGFWNSGILDAISASPPPPFNVVRVAAPGTYRLWCMIHPFMNVTITAQ